MTINRKPLEVYVTVERLRKYVTTPLEVTQMQGRFDIHVNVDGGGVTGQVGACVLGISRALIKADPTTEVALRKHGLMTRDSRMVERKKYGLHKARRGCQFSKR
jgi:small subunit ribosomal protein S9